MISPWEAPVNLLRLAGNCGPISMWIVLRHFRKRPAVSRIIRECRHTSKVGCFTVGLAVALAKFGMKVSFHSDHDPDVQPLERQLYRQAGKLGVSVQPAIGLEQVVRQIKHGRAAIVSFEIEEGVGHFSPLVGIRRNRVLLPNTTEEVMDVKEFTRRWSKPGYLRQCVLASSKCRQML
jgi:hypothetical protein